VSPAIARVDFFVKRSGGEVIINELNTMPGLTEVSGYPKMWAASGLSFPRLLEVLIELAFDRHKEKSFTKTSR
jgi:D-alanine-D-alanine ligase